MYWHEKNVIYYVKNFEDRTTWQYVCTCKDEVTADFIRNLLDFSENGFESADIALLDLEKAIADIENATIISDESVTYLRNRFLLLKKEVCR